MKRSRNMMLRIGAAVISVLLIAVLIYVTVSFAGNPITASKANQAVKNYIEEQYSDLDLYIDKKARFNFKDKTYVVDIQSKTIRDIRFTVNYRNGEILWDDYDLRVQDFSNTLMRLSDEYTAKVTELIHSKVDKRYKEIRAGYSGVEQEEDKELLSLDMPFNEKLPIETHLYVTIDLESTEALNLQTFAKRIMRLHTALLEKGFEMTNYNLYMSKGKNNIIIGNLKASEISNETELLNKIEKASQNQGEFKGISIIVGGQLD